MPAMIGREVRLKEFHPYTFDETIELIASALHDDEMARACAEINIRADLEARVKDGRLVARNPVDLGPHAHPAGRVLRDAVLLPWEVRRLLEERGIRFVGIDEPEGPEWWTISRAGAALGVQLGWHSGAIESITARMVEAAAQGDLVVRDPHTELPYRPDPVREDYDLVGPADVNAWLERSAVAYRWTVAKRSSTYILPPDWGRWASIPSARLFECVALSIDVEPECMHTGGRYNKADEDLPVIPEFMDRLGEARDQMLKGGDLRPHVVEEFDKDLACRIPVRAFGVWAKSKGWSLPAAFPLAHEVATAVPTAPLARRAVSRAEAQEEAILDALRAAGFDPQTLPSYRNGDRAGSPAKQAVRQALTDKTINGMWFTKSIINHAWQRLHDHSHIAVAGDLTHSTVGKPSAQVAEGGGLKRRRSG